MTREDYALFIYKKKEEQLYEQIEMVQRNVHDACKALQQAAKLIKNWTKTKSYRLLCEKYDWMEYRANRLLHNVKQLQDMLNEAKRFIRDFLKAIDPVRSKK